MNPKCAKTDCITDCKRKRCPKEPDNHCVDYNNGEVRSGIPQEKDEKRSKEETASFHYDIGNLHELVHTLNAKISKMEKDIAKIKEVIDTFHSTCEYSQFEDD